MSSLCFIRILGNSAFVDSYRKQIKLKTDFCLYFPGLYSCTLLSRYIPQSTTTTLISCFLGKGSFGQVIKAFDHKTQTHVALKIVRNEKRFHRQAQEEIRILEALKKQVILNYYFRETKTKSKRTKTTI